MRFFPRKRRVPVVNIVSLIDILVIVLIFFVVTTTFRKEEPVVQIELPRSGQAKFSPMDAPVVIYVTADERIFLNDTPIEPDRLGPELKERRARDPTCQFVLKASKRAPFQTIVHVMDAAKFAGIAALPTITQEEPQRP
ncbi:ExbD/TolR family protein [Candidatus Methylacidithermus pantelleriae]|uniref:Biopolymer transport protein ExbD/TolR n=1 Tax=Candidatus Methylacidithermus pantelleriae TaxID=2744239 RepID=A0A8J2BJY0_9BACT|nr:biopolymer transporter ExbD [Candidatus Methylacidithermus pantelleriae]CAF0701050.1 Biopolymer transport protein ExbD/TolR [Candidatus Methylacidithermus pantelleriae]